MAPHARLVAPPAERENKWPWHTAKHAALPLSTLWKDDRRLEAETYLSSGYGLRVAIESKPKGWRRLNELARAWQPSRLKGIVVSPEYGTPFLTATQVFDMRPTPRKWLSLEKTADAVRRFIESGTILVTCSGAVGRTAVAYSLHQKTLISHDLLRVEPKDPKLSGWLYAFLRAPQTRAMMTGAQYGSIIKHLETSHLDVLPVPDVGEEVAAVFQRQVARILELRKRAYELTLQAEHVFETALGNFTVENWGECGFSLKASAFHQGRRRLEASYNNPGVGAIRNFLRRNGRDITKLRSAGYNIWVPGRYKRIPADSGVTYYDSEDLLEVCPDKTKHFVDCGFGDHYGGRVKKGWLLMPCSGQVYGIIGTVMLAGSTFDDQVVSNHVLRIAPGNGAKLQPGYVWTALAHPTYGRPLLKALAFGASVPEIAPDDVADLEVVRLEEGVELTIAESAEASVEARSEADALECKLAASASKIIDQFVSLIA